MSLTFAPFDNEKDLSAQRALFKESFPETIGRPPETDSYYHWKMDSFPAKNPAFEYVASDASGMVGYYAAIPYSYNVDGQTMTCGMVCDVMTAVRSRGQGVFTRLGKYSLEELTAGGIDFVFGYPVRPEVIPGHLKVGWQIIFKLPVYVMPIRINTLLRGRGMELLAPLGNLAMRLISRAVRVAAPSTRGLTAQVIDWRDLFSQYDYAAFTAQIEGECRQMLKKSEDFLRWRLGAPGTEYKAVIVASGREIKGLSIVRVCSLRDIPSLAVLDLRVIGADPSVMTAIADAWRSLARENGCEVVAAMLAENRAHELRLWRHAVLRSSAVFSVILKRLSPRAQQVLDDKVEYWNLMWIDSDDL